MFIIYGERFRPGSISRWKLRVEAGWSPIFSCYVPLSTTLLRPHKAIAVVRKVNAVLNASPNDQTMKNVRQVEGRRGSGVSDLL